MTYVPTDHLPIEINPHPTRVGAGPAPEPAFPDYMYRECSVCGGEEEAVEQPADEATPPAPCLPDGGDEWLCLDCVDGLGW